MVVQGAHIPSVGRGHGRAGALLCERVCRPHGAGVVHRARAAAALAGGAPLGRHRGELAPGLPLPGNGLPRPHHTPLGHPRRLRPPNPRRPPRPGAPLSCLLMCLSLPSLPQPWRLHCHAVSMMTSLLSLDQIRFAGGPVSEWSYISSIHSTACLWMTWIGTHVVWTRSYLGG